MIPNCFLAPGKYSIWVGLHRPNVQWFDQRTNVIQFSVIETGSSDYKYAGRDIGYILVDFDWEIERKEYVA
jgi:hypothetical protein